jgi:hypothetical protein
VPTCSLRLTRRYDAAPDEVWAALRDLDAWLAPPPGVTVASEDAGRLLELDWRPDGEPPSVVRLELQREGARTTVVVEHSRVEATRGMRYLRAWTHAVERFEAQR